MQEICDIRSGGTPSRSHASFYGGNIPWAKISDIERANGVLTNTEESITPAGLEAIRGRLFDAGTLLFAIYGSIGKMAFAGLPLATNQAILGLAFREGCGAFPRYVYHWLSANNARFLGDGQGIAQKNLSARYLRELEIPLPPLEEQRRIAAILDKADELRRKRKRALGLLDSLTQSIFREMFGDPHENSHRNPVIEVGRVTTCIVPGRDKPKSFTGSIPWVTTAELSRKGYTSADCALLGLTEAEIAAVKARVVPAQSVLMTCVGDLGVVSIAKVPMVINQQLHSFQCSNRIIPEYLMHALSYQTEYMRGRATQTTLPYMNKTVCNSIPIQLPPIDSQMLFRQQVQQIDRKLRQMTRFGEKTEELFFSLQSRAFSGQL